MELAIDGRKLQNSGQAVRDIKEEAGACSSTGNNIVPVVISIEGERHVMYWLTCTLTILFASHNLRPGMQLKQL
jgi:hypothetical protein